MSIQQRAVARLRRYQRQRSIRSAHEKHRSEHRSEYARIDEIVDAYRRSGGLQHVYQAYKLWCLSELLAAHDPKRILELGSGSSTIVFANHAREHEGSLLSFDESKEWAANTARLAGIGKDDSIEIRSAEKLFLPHHDPPEVKYDVRIDGEYDLVFVDGPSLRIDGAKRKDAVNSNVFELECMPRVIVVDGRRATAECLANRYAKEYDVRLSELHSGRPLRPGYNYFSVFVNH